MSTTRNWRIRAGTDFKFQYFYASETTGAPIDFSGCTAILVMRASVSDASPLLSLSTTASADGQLLLTSGGFFSGVIVALATARIASAIAVPWVLHEAKATTPSGGIFDLLAGYSVFEPSVTH